MPVARCNGRVTVHVDVSAEAGHTGERDQHHSRERDDADAKNDQTDPACHFSSSLPAGLRCSARMTDTFRIERTTIKGTTAVPMATWLSATSGAWRTTNKMVSSR